MKHQHLIMILLLALLCLNLRIVNFVGIGINDDIAYIQNARALAQGDNPIETGFNQLGFRLGMVFPLSLLYKVFGYNEVGFSLYPIICSLITCSLIYLTALKLWGIKAAVFAGLLWAVYPLQIVFATQLSPSNQHATCVAAILFFYFYAVNNNEDDISSNLNNNSNRKFFLTFRAPVLLFICGALLGVGWLINSIFITIIFVILPFLFIVRPKIKYLLWILLGFIFLMLLELIIVKIACGSWFARFSCILQTEEAVESNTNYWYYPRALFKLFNTNPLDDEGHFGIIWYLFAVVTITALLLKQKTVFALAMGCWLWMAFLQWGFQSPKGCPIAKHIRYISMIAPIQCLVIVAVLNRLSNYSKILSRIIICLFALLLLHLGWTGSTAVRAVRIHTQDFKEIARFFTNLQLDEDEVIYTDDMTGNFLKLYSKGELTIRRVNHKKIDLPKSGYLVLDGSWYAVFLPEYRAQMPEWSLNPPPIGELLYTVHGKDICMYGHFNPKIYKILPEYQP
ncbi:MAG: glycosyltransferase family 39 protein [Phycisphaerae bacterium]